MDASDTDLLRAYAERNDEVCFEQLVNRHIGLVYSTALRTLGGDTHLAQDVAQMVFTRLARKAKGLLGQSALAGWLYRDAFFSASKMVRTERRRLEREKHATMPTSSGQDLSKELLPRLDEIISRLRPKEQDALVLRFFNGMEVRAAAAVLGISEEAFQKRVERAVHKLRAALASQGMATGPGAITAALVAGGTLVSPPASFPSLIANSATASAAAKSITGLTLVSTLTMTKLKIAAPVLLVAALTTPILIQRNALTKLREENSVLRAENQRSLPRNEAPAPLETVIDPTEIDHLRAEHSELMRLRGEVGVRRRQILELKAKLDQASRTAEPKPGAEEHEEGGIYYAAESWANLGLNEPQSAAVTFFWALRNGDQAVYSGALGKAMPPPVGGWIEAFKSVKGSFVSDPEPQSNGEIRLNVAHELTDGRIVNTTLIYRRDKGQWLIRQIAGFPIVLVEATSGQASYELPILAH